MAEIIFITHRIPYPPNKGDKIRSFNFLKYLAERHEVHLATFIDDPADSAYIERLSPFCTSLHVVELKPRWAKLQSLAGLAAGQALTVGYYRSREVRDWVSRVLAERAIAAIVTSSSGVGQYALQLPKRGVRRIMDFVDVDSAKWLQYAHGEKGPMRCLYAREAHKLAREERRIAATFDASIFVSNEEAALFAHQAPESAAKIHGISNGVDTDFFDPGREYARPYHDFTLPVVFTGMMDYRANVEGVLWFVRHVLPLIREQQLGIRFYIVGARPTRAVRELNKEPDIEVTGKVPDVRPYLAHARMAVAPLRIARGIQNKVLEALAMGKPVIGTPQAYEGIKRSPLLSDMTAAEPAGFASSIQRVLACNVPLSDIRLRNFVCEHYNWAANLALLDTLIVQQPNAAAKTAPEMVGGQAAEAGR